MPDDGAGTRFTLLGPVDEVDDDDARLIDFYTYPDDLQSCWVRGNMIASLDGGATEKGTTGGLAGPGDRALFSLMRHAADVILVGAATVRMENYSGAQFTVEARQARQRRGQAEVPPIAVVTQTGVFHHDAKLFTRTEAPPLVLTCAQTATDIRRRLGSLAEVIDASASDPELVDCTTMLKILAERGLFRVLTEGGPQLLSELIEADLLDELCLTVAPILVGGVARRIATGPGEVHTTLRRTHILTDDEGYLYTRYARGT